MSAIGSPRVSTAFTAGWLAFVSTNAVLMYLLPGEETIPYHLIWASFAFIYGVVSWPGWATWTAFAAITVVTGVAIMRYVVIGEIRPEECSEIVLMGAIVATLVWHVNRHRAAVQNIADLREAERVRGVNRELATRFGSHELRTRLTIARGLTDLIRESVPCGSVQNDAAMAIAELDKASALATSLMTLVRVDAVMPMESADLDELIDITARRWAARVRRDWVTHSFAGFIVANSERIQVVLDCLVENAVKFTEDDDVIAITADLDGSEVVITVSDSGSGIPSDELDQVTHLFHTGRVAGKRAGSGLGLPIVLAAVEAHAGTLNITSDDSGTQVTVRLPRGHADPSPEELVDRATVQTVHRPLPTNRLLADHQPEPSRS